MRLPSGHQALLVSAATDQHDRTPSPKRRNLAEIRHMITGGCASESKSCEYAPEAIAFSVAVVCLGIVGLDLDLSHPDIVGLDDSLPKCVWYWAVMGMSL